MTSPPKSSKTLATENPSTFGPHVSLLLYTNRFIFSAQPSSPMFSSAATPVFVLTTLPLSQQNADPKIEFRNAYWNPVSDQAKSFIRRLAALDPFHRPAAEEASCNPCRQHRDAIPRSSLPHSQTKLES